MTDGLVTVNNEVLAMAQTRNGGYTRAQLTAIGVPWPPPRRWKAAILGRRIPRHAFDALMSEAGT
jgi:hypothetical protein